MTKPVITAYKWVPPFAQGLVRDTRARWAFEEVGIDYDVDVIDLPYAKSEAHRRFQPFGQVPTYSDGKVEIFESGAIVLHIASLAPGLLPDDSTRRAGVVQWVIAALNSIEPFVQQLAVVDVFEADRDWSKARRPKVIEDLKTRLGDLAAALGDKEWLDGNGFTAGDLMMIAVLRALRGTGILDDFPALAAYVARGEARATFKKAIADHMAVFAAAA